MCYRALTNQCAKRRIAKKDLIVFKVGRLNNNNFVPYYHEFYRYKIGVKQPKVELLYNPESRSIDSGYHSYKYAEFKSLANRPVEFYIDGKEMMRTLAPHQSEFDEYSRMTSLAFR